MASFFRKLANAMSPPAISSADPPISEDLSSAKAVDIENVKSPITESTSPKSNEFTSSSEGLKSAVDRLSVDSNTTTGIESAGRTDDSSTAAAVVPADQDVDPECSETKLSVDQTSEPVLVEPTDELLLLSQKQVLSDPELRKKNEALADSACKLIQEIVDDETGWEVWENKNNIKIEKKTNADGSVTGRSTYRWVPNLSEVKPYDLAFVEESLWELNAKKEYDDQAIEMLLMKEYENDYHVVYQAFKGRFGVPGRDFIVCLHKSTIEFEEGLKLVIGAMSTADEDGEKIESEVESEDTKQIYDDCKKNLVRGYANVAGFVVYWIKEKNEFVLHYVNDADLKTKGIPAWLVTRAKLDQLRVVDKVKIMIERKRREKIDDE